ncbi:hypothetical protein H2200_007687 [Cladophialophora chaetospira]|uniref:Uncharacterized protein n=1 Tax=Cladophialophora chaetospira TaxID=386627 RepID=A0AA38X6D9_9EURO|nr:hypothetical protein H2200_007687 [Cladophialophora chaetospira]
MSLVMHRAIELMEPCVCLYQQRYDLKVNSSVQKRIGAPINPGGCPPQMATELIWYFFARLNAKIIEWQEGWAREKARKRLELKAAELKDDWEFTRPRLLEELRALDWEDMQDLADDWGVLSFQQHPMGIVDAIDETLLNAYAKEAAAMKLELN